MDNGLHNDVLDRDVLVGMMNVSVGYIVGYNDQVATDGKYRIDLAIRFDLIEEWICFIW